MSKAVLIMDMPESCEKCPCCRIGSFYDICQAKKRARDTRDKGMPDWCPLRPMPEKEEEKKTDIAYDIIIKRGWNACIDELTAGSIEEVQSETNKETHQST